jgi:hypothetical protein
MSSDGAGYLGALIRGRRMVTGLPEGCEGSHDPCGIWGEIGGEAWGDERPAEHQAQ